MSKSADTIRHPGIAHPSSQDAQHAYEHPAGQHLGYGLPVPGLSSPGADTVRRTASADPLGGTAIEPGVVAALRRRRGQGSALDADVASSMGQALGADLGSVRVHTDSEADTISRSVQAQAFTAGSDIYFSKGAYAPNSDAGRHLLAHELTHVAQQQAGLFAGAGGTIGPAADPAEAHAEAAASRVVGALRRRAATANR